MLAESLAKYLNFGEGNPIEFLFLIERETNEIGTADDNSWWLNVGIETGAAEFAIEIDDIFAVWLVDAAIGERSVMDQYLIGDRVVASEPRDRVVVGVSTPLHIEDTQRSSPDRIRTPMPCSAMKVCRYVLRKAECQHLVEMVGTRKIE